MRELLRCNDPVVLSFAEAVLAEAGIWSQVLDVNMSILEGSIGAFPRRLTVQDDDLGQARRLMTGAGLGSWIVDGGT